MTNLLLWRPNRMQVLGTKLGVGLGLIGVVSVVFSLIYIGTFYAIAATMGYAGGMTTESWSNVGLITLRGLGLALLAGLISFAIATIGRHTAAALGALLGYVIVWEGGARLIMEVANRSGGGNDPFFLSSYVAAWFAGRYDYYTYFNYNDSGPWSIHWWQAAVVFAVLGGAALAVAFTGFRRRDLA
jgi:ABC-type transport system involved in multi-copper enzyme maturation permease subunit